MRIRSVASNRVSFQISFLLPISKRIFMFLVLFCFPHPVSFYIVLRYYIRLTRAYVGGTQYTRITMNNATVYCIRCNITKKEKKKPSLLLRHVLLYRCKTDEKNTEVKKKK